MKKKLNKISYKVQKAFRNSKWFQNRWRSKISFPTRCQGYIYNVTWLICETLQIPIQINSNINNPTTELNLIFWNSPVLIKCMYTWISEMVLEFNTCDCITQGRQENFWAPGQKETWSPSSNSPNNDTQTKSTTVCHKQGISTTKMNWWIVI